MKDLVNKIYFIVYCFLLVCCQTKTSSPAREFDEFLKAMNYKNADIVAYVVLPVDICPSCIETYKTFIKDTPFSNITFILSGSSQKVLRLTFGTDLLQLDNVLVDAKGLFYNTHLYKDIGQIFFIEGSKVVEIREIGINNLNEELASLTQRAKSKSHLIKKKERSADDLSKYVNDLLNTPESSPYFSHLIGKNVPLFQGLTMNGTYFKLSDFIGKPMVLNFWFVNCPNCYEEIPDLNRVFEDSKKQDFVFMSFCKDQKSTLDRSFEITGTGGYKRKKSQKKDQIMFYDFVPGATDIIDQLNIKAFPVTVTVGKDGKITNVVLYTKSHQFPNELITYLLIKSEIERIR